MRNVFVVVLAIVSGLHFGRAASPIPAAPNRYIAHRYDDTRVVFSLERTFSDDPELRQRNLAQNPTRLPDPATRLAGMTLWKMNEAFWKRHARDLAGFAIGDRWVLEAGGIVALHFTIQDLTMAEVACGTTVAAIGEVEEAEQAAFRVLGVKHYLAVRESDFVEVGLHPVVPAILTETPALSPSARERLEASLQEQFQRELPRVRRVSAARYALMSQLGQVHPWEVRDERLARGEGKLFYDFRAVRVTPDQQDRYYVRARWVLDRETVFLMSAWIWPARDMLVESVYTRPSEWMRMSEFQSERLGFADLGILLNVFDYDGDGWGEVLVAQRRIEGFHMHLLKYTDGRGPQPTGVTYRYGC